MNFREFIYFDKEKILDNHSMDWLDFDLDFDFEEFYDFEEFPRIPENRDPWKRRFFR